MIFGTEIQRLLKANQIEKIQKGRNHTIDLLRFLAASGVILFHLNEPIPYINNFYRDFCKLGYLGVPIFFVISGYCIKIAEDHSKSASQFIVRRLFRIFPPYWVSILLVVIYAIIVKLITGTNSTPLPKDFPSVSATLFLFTTPVTHYKTINWVYWTLPYELTFYLIIAGFMIFDNGVKKIAIVILLVASILLPFQPVGGLFFFNELPTFVLGYSLYLLLNKVDVINGMLFVISIVAVLSKHTNIDYLLVSMGTCIIIFIDKIMPLKNNFFSTLGDYSYSMYLIHVPICIYLLGFIKSHEIVQVNVWLNIIVDLSLLCLIVFISKFTFEWIELKSIQIGKKLAK